MVGGAPEGAHGQKKPVKRKGMPLMRTRRKDKKGVRLTSDQPPFTLLPSDLEIAMRQPPGTPTKATRKVDPRMPTTAIPELNEIAFSPFAYETVIEAIDAAGRVQMNKINPTGGLIRPSSLVSCSIKSEHDGLRPLDAQLPVHEVAQHQG
jgi:hypothetical protein